MSNLDATEEVERVARAICQVRERNGGPPYDGLDLIFGRRHAKKLREELFEEARAAIDALASERVENGKRT